MKLTIPVLVILIVLFLASDPASCQNNTEDISPVVENHPETVGEISCVNGFKRILCESDTFSGYVRNLPLKPALSPVRAWNGSVIHEGTDINAVIDWKLPDKVQQCADVAIRLYSEFLREMEERDKIRFRSLSGEWIVYEKWLKGNYKLDNTGSHIKYIATRDNKPDSDQTFEEYLNFVMLYANSSSLARDLNPVSEEVLIPGDLFIQPDQSGRGGIGHLSVLLDISENADGDRLYLFGYGFIPAQDFHLPLPVEDQGIEKWFTLDGYKDFISAFGEGKFYRF